jgi:hypothetical protein
MPSVSLWRKAVTKKVRAWGGLREKVRLSESEVSYPKVAIHSHVTPKTKFPTHLIMLRCHPHGLQKNILLNDELGRHFHVTRKIIMGVSQGCDTDTCERTQYGLAESTQAGAYYEA